MRLPQVYILGAPKAGTTSLSRWLASHPSVFFSKPKEPTFWATDYPRLRKARGFDQRAAYERLFSSADAQQATLRAEGSTVYLYSEEAVPNIWREMGDEARFIVALRNPADLVVSYHRTQQLLLNEDEPDFTKAWMRSMTGGQPDSDTLDGKLVDYQTVGSLGAAVDRVLAVVPRSYVHFTVFESLRDEPEQVWSALAGFLELSPEPVPSFEVHNPSNRMFRSPLLHRLRARPPALLAPSIRRMRHASMRTSNKRLRGLKRAFWWQEQPKPSVSAETRDMLTEFFADDVRRLGTQLEIDLSAWTTTAH